MSETESKTSEKEAVTRIYEAGFHILPSVSEEEVPREMTAIKDRLEKSGAVTIADEFPKLRPLAYPIRKRIAGAYQTFTNAYFGWIKFEGDAENITEIEQALKAMERILRFIIVKTVRESTMTAPRAPRLEKRVERKDVPKDGEAPKVVSEIELDKSLEKIIAE